MEQIWQVIGKMGGYLLGPNFVYSPAYLASTIVIAFLVWRLQGRSTGFLRFVLPRELYRHPSTLLDIKIGVFNAILAASGVLSVLFVTPVVTHAIIGLLADMVGQAPVENGWARGLAAAAILFLTQDFCRFLNHYFHHGSRVLWPFHAVHHSAEVLTPITFMRAHPLYYAFQALLISVLVGAAQALIVFLVVGRIELWAVYANALAFNAYVFFGLHFRHSHIWISYGPALEHILISPAQHQIHHSSDPRHFDKNFGEIFAIWDWMFGTLYVPEGSEELTFGIADAEGRHIEQPHPTLRAALLAPFTESWHEIRRITRPAPGRGAGAARELP